MADFVVNPRRAPRAPVRCRAEITGADRSRWTAETEDFGPRGCQVVAPSRRSAGEPLQLQISAEGLARNLRVGGRVAWASPTEPWRLGVAFDPVDAAVAADWFEALLSRNPALASYRGVPERIAMDASVFLGPPPRLVMDFTTEEIRILQCIGSGTSVAEIVARLKGSWERAQHALFSLLARRHLVLARGAAVLPSAWKEILSGLEATLAVEELGKGAPAVPAPPRVVPPASARTPPPARPTPPPASAPPPLRAVTPPPIGAAPARAEPRSSVRALDSGAWTAAPQHQPDFDGAGVGWRSPPRARSPEADRLLRQATGEAEEGKVDAAIGTLRRALQLAPGDPEIAALLGRLAFRDRSAPRK